MVVFKILGIDSTATKNEVKAAFREIAKRTHPDKTVANYDNTLFMTAKIACDILSDDKKRKAYLLASTKLQDTILYRRVINLYKISEIALSDIELEEEKAELIEVNKLFYIAKPATTTTAVPC